MSRAVSSLAQNLLASRTIVASGCDQGLSESLRGLGAQVIAPGERPGAAVDALVHDARPGFGDGGPEGLRAALEQAWDVVAAVATGTMIDAPGEARIVLIGPPAGARSGSEPTRAGLENLARTLSVEWARYAITTTMIAPGASTTADELATLVAFLVSGAGGYYSGCRFELGAA